jgi:type I restriction enzyme M protein
LTGWVGTIRDALTSDDEISKKDQFNPLDHKLVKRLLPGYLQELEEAQTRIAELEQRKATFEGGEELDQAVLDALGLTDEEESEEEGTTRNVAALLNERVRALKKELKGAVDWALRQELSLLEEALKPYATIGSELRDTKKRLKALRATFVRRLEEAHAALPPEEGQRLVLAIFRDDLAAQLERYVTAHRQQVITAVEGWWDKYRVTLQDIECKRQEVDSKLKVFVGELGYAF